MEACRSGLTGWSRKPCGVYPTEVRILPPPPLTKMCVATPVKILKLKGTSATVDALGKKLEVNTSLLKEVSVGDYLLAKGDLAIQKLSPSEAEEIRELVRECEHDHE